MPVAGIRDMAPENARPHEAEMAEPEVTTFLSHLARGRQVSASTQNQALCAILFLYRHVIARPLGRFDALVWAKRSAHVPISC